VENGSGKVANDLAKIGKANRDFRIFCDINRIYLLEHIHEETEKLNGNNLYPFSSTYHFYVICDIYQSVF